MITAHQLGHVNTKSTEDAGEFAGDEAGSHNHHTLREALQQKHVITDPTKLGTLDIWPLRPAADTDEHSLGT